MPDRTHNRVARLIAEFRDYHGVSVTAFLDAGTKMGIDLLGSDTTARTACEYRHRGCDQLGRAYRP